MIRYKIRQRMDVYNSKLNLIAADNARTDPSTHRQMLAAPNPKTPNEFLPNVATSIHGHNYFDR